MHRPLITLFSLALLGSFACADDSSRPVATQRGPAASAATTDFIAMQDGAPEEVLWDDAQQRLLIVDNVDNRVWTWTDKDGLAKEPPGAAGLRSRADARADQLLASVAGGPASLNRQPLGSAACRSSARRARTSSATIARFASSSSTRPRRGDLAISYSSYGTGNEVATITNVLAQR